MTLPMNFCFQQPKMLHILNFTSNKCAKKAFLVNLLTEKKKKGESKKRKKSKYMP